MNNHGYSCLGVFKVTSHAEADLADPAECWAIRGNQTADDCAAAAYSNHPVLLDLWHQLGQQIDELQEIRYWLHRKVIRVGFEAIRKTRQAKRDGQSIDTGEVTMPQLDYSKWELPLTPPVNRHFRVGQWEKISAWTMSLHVDGEQVQWWSWPQLFVDFCLTALTAHRHGTVEARRIGRQSNEQLLIPFKKLVSGLALSSAKPSNNVSWRTLKNSVDLHLMLSTTGALVCPSRCPTIGSKQLSRGFSFSLQGLVPLRI